MVHKEERSASESDKKNRRCSNAIILHSSR